MFTLFSAKHHHLQVAPKQLPKRDIPFSDLLMFTQESEENFGTSLIQTFG